ncbi:ACP S-malonyltransferase [Deferribacterales bacterium Es71-Z0220]|uniref:ACP S-malonyltransferase n=1 Tax=Deferrivibrio essentukiensis TaxID=2880922 RepID=UPI001F60D6C5|nr:ACP S-malonyltransferase [Deferrivibrio essentukiensis]MCB4204868.1 ACP S-malonyltransferase [Deferrivibrio essentukiensis]
MKLAVIFPGQGSQYVGMAKDFYEKFDKSKYIIDRANTALEYDLKKIMFEGPEEELKITYNTQPALLTGSIAIWEVIKDKLNPVAFAGHSLGEYTALVAAGSISFEDAVRAVHNRGKFMQEAVPVGVGAMAAVLGGDVDKIENLCRAISVDEKVVEPANYNCDGQLVVAGHAGAVDEFISKIKETGAKRAVKLPVSAPFHCSLMKPAQEKMRDYLETVCIKDIDVPVYNNVDAEKENKMEVIKDALIRQVSGAVRWTRLIENMIEDGVDTFVEVGAGSVLTGLVKKINKNVSVFNISTVEDLNKLES